MNRREAKRNPRFDWRGVQGNALTKRKALKTLAGLLFSGLKKSSNPNDPISPFNRVRCEGIPQWPASDPSLTFYARAGPLCRDPRPSIPSIMSSLATGRPSEEWQRPLRETSLTSTSVSVCRPLTMGVVRSNF